MAMSVGDNTGSDVPRAEINVTPLADVMLVLLIIFMITAPLMSHKVKVDLPRANPNTKPAAVEVPPIDLAVEPDGTLYWNDNQASDAVFSARRSEEHTSELQSPVHLVCRLLLEKKNKQQKKR